VLSIVFTCNVKILHVVLHIRDGCLVFVRQIRTGRSYNDATEGSTTKRPPSYHRIVTSPLSSVLPYIPLQSSSHSDHTDSGDVNYVIAKQVSGRG
jgi:hypothetical protein